MNDETGILLDNIRRVLSETSVTAYLYGSAATDDYQYGWSDIDILCLCGSDITISQAKRLLNLRQLLIALYDNPLYRLYEGGILPLKAFLRKESCTTVYWGTGGQRIMDTYAFDCFSMFELKTSGILLCGEDVRGFMDMPGYEDMKRAVIGHYQTIRHYAVQTNESLYSCGWLLDIARCIYTLRTGKVIAKTRAGEWALEHKICPVENTLRKAVQVRRNPLQFKDDPEYQGWARSLGADVQIFADVLEREILLAERESAPPS